jgi:hypothetical protein
MLTSDLPTDPNGVNLERAIACYWEALRIWTPETAPLDYASTQHNLGNAYSDLPIGDRSANLAQAIACYGRPCVFGRLRSSLWTMPRASTTWALPIPNCQQATGQLTWPRRLPATKKPCTSGCGDRTP